MSKHIAKFTDWKTNPFGDCVDIPYETEFTAEETVRLKFGLIPNSMEDKWFVYYDENEVFFHRSWTGDPVYKFCLIETEEGSRVVKSEMESRFFNKEYADHSAALLNWLVSSLLLGKTVPYPEFENTTT